MTSAIRNHKDLSEEKQRLQNLLIDQKQQIRHNFIGIKEELRPVNLVFSYISKFFTKDKRNPLVNASVDVISYYLLRKVLLARSGKVTKKVIPLLFKNYASHAFKEKGDLILLNFISWLKSKKFKLKVPQY